MTITIEQIEFEEKVRKIKSEIGIHTENIRTSLSCLEQYMQHLHKLLPHEHIASFSVTLPEIPNESKEEVVK